MKSQSYKYFPQSVPMVAVRNRTFDLGIYYFHPVVMGPMCKDESKVGRSAVLGIIHPLQLVNQDNNLYVFAVDKNGNIYTLLRQNVRFKKLITLPYELAVEEVEVHAKLNAAYNFLADKTKQTQLL